MAEVTGDVVQKVIAHAAALRPRIAAKNPRVHCITNTVAQAYTANMLLAGGATPSVTTSPEEIGGFLAAADNLLVNLGTLDRERRDAVGIALDTASARRLPWVLDPVFVDRSPSRLEFARVLLSRKPAAIRLNAAELAALAGAAASAESARRFAAESGAIIALTGEVDVVTDGARFVQLQNGDELMGKVTAMGCAGSAFVASALALGDDPWLATAAAMMVFGIAGERAAEEANGPGSLGVTILDCLYAMTAETVEQYAWAEA